MFENLEGAMRKSRGGKQKQGADCLQSDIWAFGIAGDREVQVLEAEMWDKTVTEGGRRLMASWMK